jgi:hypothetical protein
MKRSKNQVKTTGSANLMVTARFDHSWFLSSMIEELASTRTEAGFAEIPMHEGSLAVETSSIEAFVSGNIVFSDDDKHRHFQTGFLFTCIKPADGTYKFVWSNSLS